MSDHADIFLADTIDKIEGSYEFMLAYAAQGRDFESSGGATGPSIRQYLSELEQALGKLTYAIAEKIEELDPAPAQRSALEHFKNLMIDDAARAQLAVKVVLAVPSISSQIVDNLNASTHLRCLLTDMFLLDEALKLVERGTGSKE